MLAEFDGGRQTAIEWEEIQARLDLAPMITDY